MPTFHQLPVLDTTPPYRGKIFLRVWFSLPDFCCASGNISQAVPSGWMKPCWLWISSTAALGICSSHWIMTRVHPSVSCLLKKPSAWYLERMSFHCASSHWWLDWARYGCFIFCSNSSLRVRDYGLDWRSSPSTRAWSIIPQRWNNILWMWQWQFYCSLLPCHCFNSHHEKGLQHSLLWVCWLSGFHILLYLSWLELGWVFRVSISRNETIKILDSQLAWVCCGWWLLDSYPLLHWMICAITQPCVSTGRVLLFPCHRGQTWAGISLLFKWIWNPNTVLCMLQGWFLFWWWQVGSPCSYTSMKL